MSLDELNELLNVPFRFWSCPRCPQSPVDWKGDNAICGQCGYNRHQWMIDTAGFTERIKQDAAELARVREENERLKQALAEIRDFDPGTDYSISPYQQIENNRKATSLIAEAAINPFMFTESSIPKEPSDERCQNVD